MNQPAAYDSWAPEFELVLICFRASDAYLVYLASKVADELRHH